ncbi:SH3 domain-containing protein [Piscinibacter sp. HJYY11]|uniref:SH3 domain-containing protein n=1 Tax=Piscinibacter sp. HJYY11 TaxID=2801333 RepID=UPI00191CB43D|nr:SH3 domain-containing protein [Piscinibacter sp. HJYY11]MBL0730991.1 SH3 domain-containing protein [Piscinibacter sp. HJYY11]
MNVPRVVRSVACALALGAVAGLASPVFAADAPRERLTVADPYLEVHTGPGRGYPVFHVVERADWVEIELRRTDWYKIRTSDGKVGWVVRQQLERTIAEAGGQKTFRDVALDDYLKRKLEMGAGYGRFKKEPMLKLWMGYRLSDTLSLEGTVAQVQGVFSGTDLWHFNLISEPWSDKRWSPFFGVGIGKFKNIPNQSLVGAQLTNVNLANGTIGLRYYLTDRFVLRTDYTFYTAFLSDARYGEYRAVTAGLSFFF